MSHPFYQLAKNEDGTSSFKSCMMHTLPDSLRELFRDPMVFVNQLPENQRDNVVYALNHVSKKHPAHKRVFESTDAIAFDIDGIFDKEKGVYTARPDYSRMNEYIEVVCETLKIDPTKTVFVNSGVGIHIIISTRKNSKEDFFTRNKKYYSAVCKKLDDALALRGLQGKLDQSIFDKARVLRLPMTLNVKPDKGIRALVELVTTNLEPQLDFDLIKLSGLDFDKNEHYGTNKKARDKSTDDLIEVNVVDQKAINVKAIEEGCGFLKHARENSHTLEEPLWKAAISILARLDDDGAKCHEYSIGHKDYSHTETEKARERALSLKGPYRCKTIDGLGFDGCRYCPHFGKAHTPLRIVGEDDIKSEAFGFSSVDEKGRRLYHVEDLIKYFQKKHVYINVETRCYLYIKEKGFYELQEKNFYRKFAQDHYRPAPKTYEYDEFYKKMILTNPIKHSFFRETIKNKMNLKNGYFDFKEMKFLPHSHEIGFISEGVIEYDEAAKSPIYDKMIKKITCNDESLEKFLDQLGGYAVSGCDYWLQHAFILEGGGSNGKSSWMNLFKKILGEEITSNLTMQDFGDTLKLTMLERASVNVCDEVPPFKNLYTDAIKKLTGKSSMTARGLYKDPFNFQNKAKLIFACNELPKTSDATDGLKRRLKIIPFKVKLSKDDEDFNPHIDRDLDTELSGILMRFINGYRTLLAAGDFVDVEKIDASTAKYNATIQASSSKNFIDNWIMTMIQVLPRDVNQDFIDKKDEPFITKKELWETFVEDLETEGHRKNEITSTAFFIRLYELRPVLRERTKSRRIDKGVFKCLISTKLNYDVSTFEIENGGGKDVFQLPN